VKFRSVGAQKILRRRHASFTAPDSSVLLQECFRAPQHWPLTLRGAYESTQPDSAASLFKNL